MIQNKMDDKNLDKGEKMAEKDALTSDTVPHPNTKRRKALAPTSFYSSSSRCSIKKDDRQTHVDLFVMEYMRRLKNKALLKQRDVLWRQFHTQQDAFDFADREDPDGEYLRVFSQELESNGSRKFLVSSYVEFWRRYKDIPQKFRHFYEIIREGWPCHAYFDLEFGKEENPDLDGEKAMDSFFHLLKRVLQLRMNIILDEKWIIEFDSSSDVKFSRHVIVRLPGAAFLDNAHVGHFAQEIIHQAMQQRDGSKFSRMMFVMDKHGHETTFIDSGVYSRNRAFRLFQSSKAGKNIPLVPTKRMLAAWSHNFPDEKIFLHSLVSNIDPMARLLACSEDDEGQAFRIAEVSFKKRNMSREGKDVQRGSSPYPKLDEFVLEVCRHSVRNTGPRTIGVRSWVAMDNGSILIYNLSGYRFCNNIGREHKSNGVFIVVDTHEGIWYQKCYDPECKGYKSPSCPIPESVLSCD